MNFSTDRQARREQKEILKGLYADYNPIYHDAFVDKYNKELDAKALKRYMINRGIISPDNSISPNGENTR